MERESKFKSAGNPGTLAGAVVLVVLSALVAGCSTGYEKLSPQRYDGNYDVFSVLSWGGNQDVFLIKAYESEGKVALCGGYTQGASPASETGSREWADRSQVYIEDQMIGTAAFMAVTSVASFRDGSNPQIMKNDLEYRRPAMPCVRSNIPWKPSYKTARIERRGIQRILVRDGNQRRRSAESIARCDCAPLVR